MCCCQYNSVQYRANEQLSRFWTLTTSITTVLNENIYYITRWFQTVTLYVYLTMPFCPVRTSVYAYEEYFKDSAKALCIPGPLIFIQFCFKLHRTSFSEIAVEVRLLTDSYIPKLYVAVIAYPWHKCIAGLTHFCKHIWTIECLVLSRDSIAFKKTYMSGRHWFRLLFFVSAVPSHLNNH